MDGVRTTTQLAEQHLGNAVDLNEKQSMPLGEGGTL